MKKSKLPTSYHKPKLSEINELSIAVFICKTEAEPELKKYIESLGGKILSSLRGKGLSRSAFAAAIGAYTNINVVFAMCQTEISRRLVHDVSIKFKFNEQGNGKGFLINSDGYMGAKARFIGE